MRFYITSSAAINSGIFYSAIPHTKGSNIGNVSLQSKRSIIGRISLTRLQV